MIVVLMGVSGSGKTTVGRLLGADLGWEFLDADDYHPPANRQKMARGSPLTDADRAPWLDAVVAVIRERLRSGSDAVLACSALRQAYRDRLRLDPAVRFVHLTGDAATIRRRIEGRHGHYFGAGLLASQLEALEEPADALAVDIAQDPPSIVRRIERELGLEPDVR